VLSSVALSCKVGHPFFGCSERFNTSSLGYGMTENCGTCTRCIPKDPTDGGSVGFMQPVNEIKLVDVPSMGYTSEDKPHPRGEICVRGANCFSGYYKSRLHSHGRICRC